MRIELACGGQALAHIQNIWNQNREVSRTLSVPMPDTGAGAKQIKQALADEKFRTVGLKRKLMAAAAESFRGKKRVLHFAEDLNGGELRELADTVCSTGAEIAAVASGSDEAGYQICIVSPEGDTRPLGKALRETFSCRGGGKAEAFQGSISASQEALRAFFAAQWGEEG